MSNDLWISVCDERDLTPDTGLCALHQEEQVAIFKARKTNELFAVSNYDPIGKANVISRGMIGSYGDEIVVTSPLYKDPYSLRTGACMAGTELKLKTYDVRSQDGKIQLKAS